MLVLFSLGDTIKSGIIGILLTLDTFIYGLIGSAFRIFMAIASARLLSSDAYYEVANRVYVIIGVLMLFVLSYAILRGIIDPDQSMKGDLGPKMVKNVVIAVVGLAITPVIFNLLYQAQNLFLEHDVLAKIFFRSNSDLSVNLGSSSVTVGDQSTSVDPNVSVDDKIKEIGGSVTATNLWEAFFHPAEDSGKTSDEIEADPSDYFLAGGGYLLACAGLAVAAALVPVGGWILGGAAVVACLAGVSNINSGIEGSKITDGDKITLSEAYALTSGGGSFGIYTVFLNNYIEDGEIEYFWGLSTIAGIFVLYAFVSFSIDMGVRAAKMAYYQIIAPVPLIMQVLPSFKDNFRQYTKSVVSTFMEVFIRISVVYIVVYIICHLYDLFSTTSALWANDDLNSIETLLALALLILGLVAFARQAPKFISESLKLNTGNMSLGIGKKFAEGGGFAAKAIATSGVRTAAQNWNRNKDQNFGRRLGSALAGFGSATARSAYAQFGPGANHKMAMDNESSKRVSANATNAAYDAGVNRKERQDRHGADVTNLQNAQAELEAAEAAYDAAVASGNAADIERTRAARDAAIEKTRKARVAWVESSGALGAAATDAYKRATAWATGTIDLSKEEADIKFGAALDDMKSKTREEAYKKDAVSKAWKQQMETLQATKISEYREGWDENSYNAEIQRLTATQFADLRTKQNARVAAQNALDAAVAAGAPAADIATYTAALTAAQADETASRSAFESARTAAISSLEGVAKRSDLEMSQARTELQSKIEATRRTMEAAADAWVAANITSNQNLQNTVQGVISQYSDYISQNQTRMVTTLDADGNQVQVQLSDLLAPFGANAATSAQVDFSNIKHQNTFVLDEVAPDGTVSSKTYKRKYRTNPDGTETDLGYEDESGAMLSAKELFDRAYNSMSRDNSRKITTQTAVGKVADDGKGVKNATPLTRDYIDKVTRKRQAEENKNGRR